MRIIITLLLALFLQSFFVVKADTREDRRRRELLSITNDELRELNRLTRSTGKKNPVILLRRAELLLQKARLIREEENQAYLKISVERRRRRSKKSYFVKSHKVFMEAQKVCQYILKRFRRFDKKYRVYYILAYNAREFQNLAKSKAYFAKVLKHAPKKSAVYKNTKIALAEMYYNDHQYSKAIPLYESLLESTKNDKWHTKYLHNLAWCYFRKGRGERAISTMKRVYYLSKKSKYVDMSGLAERDLGQFYADEKKTDEAIAFFKKNGKDLIGSLLVISKNLQDQGKFKAAAKVLSEGKRKAKSERDKIKITIEILSLYENYENIPRHYEATKSLFQYYQEGKLKRDEKKILIYNLKRMSAQLQKDVIDKKTKKRKFKAKYSVKYFTLLSQIETKKAHQSIFYSAEVLYSVGQYNQAVDKYHQSYQMAIKRRDRKIQKLSLEGLLACLGKKSISKAAKKKYLKFGYITYLKNNPKGEKTNRIYQRLFEVYRNEGNIVKSEETLLRYRSQFPNETKIQEAMLGRVMDYHKKNKNRQGILKWVNKINDKEFVVSQRYANKVRKLLLNMRFEKVEKIVSSGNNKEGLNLYLNIYLDENSGPKEKKNAAYNIAVILYELSHAQKTYEWTKKALVLMEPKEVKKFQATLALITSDIFGRRMFKEAAEINSIVFKKMCNLKTKYLDIFYKNSVLLYLSENNLMMAQKIIDKGNTCRLSKSVQSDMKFEHLKALIDLKRWSQVEESMADLAKRKQNYPRLIHPLSQLKKAYLDVGRAEEGRSINTKILNYYKHSKAKKMNIPLESLDVVSELYIVKLRRQVKKLKSIELEFPEKIYNSRLKAKFQALDKVTTESLANFSIGSGKGIVKTYKILIQSYQLTVDQILSFSPPGKSEKYVKSFRKSMKSVVAPLSSKIRDFKVQAANNIEKHNILSVDNYQFISKLKNVPINIKYFPRHDGVLMDKGGRQ